MALWKSSVQVQCLLCGDEKLPKGLLEIFFFCNSLFLSYLSLLKRINIVNLC